MKLTNDGNIYFPTNDGHFISENQRRINQILQDYDSSLQLQWIPPGERNADDTPFRVVHFPKNGTPPYLVCVADECDERLLAKVFEADQRNRKGTVLSYLENYNNAIDLMRSLKAAEELHQRHDLAASIIRNSKSKYMHGGIDFERPRYS